MVDHIGTKPARDPACQHAALISGSASDTRSGGLAQRLHCFAIRRCRALTRIGGIKRGILFAAHRLARELDEVVGGKPDSERRIDLAMAQGVASGAPEWPPVIGNESNAD